MTEKGLISAASDSLKEVQTLEVLTGYRLRVIADRWGYTPARICQIASKSPEHYKEKGYRNPVGNELYIDFSQPGQAF